jgi:hypothetical protein
MSPASITLHPAVGKREFLRRRGIAILSSCRRGHDEARSIRGSSRKGDSAKAHDERPLETLCSRVILALDEKRWMKPPRYEVVRRPVRFSPVE